MSRLILHLGLPKSGSSAIQDYCEQHRNRLPGQGLHWMAGSRGSNQTELAVAFSERENTITDGFGIRDDHDRRDLRDQVGRRLRTAFDHDHEVIISSEHLTVLLRTPSEVARLADFLAGLVDQVLVIGVIRRADYWLPSAYAEAVRSGRDVKLGPAFVRRRAHLLDHQALLARWSTAFGPESIRLIPFLESDKSDPAAIPRRFLAAAGVPRSQTAGWPGPERLSRPGPGAEAVEVLRRINPRLGLDSWRSGADRERLICLLAERHPGSGVALTPAARRELIKNQWIHTGVDRTPAAYGDGWPEWSSAGEAPVDPPPHVSDDVIAETVAAIGAAGFGSGGKITDRFRRTLQRMRR